VKIGRSVPPEQGSADALFSKVSALLEGAE